MIRLQASWEEVARAALRERYVELGAGLTDSAPLACSGDAVTIAVGAAFHQRATTQHELIDQFESILSVVGQRPLRVILKVRESGDRTLRYRQAQEHPLTRLLISRFDADIVARELVDPNKPGPAPTP